MKTMFVATCHLWAASGEVHALLYIYIYIYIYVYTHTISRRYANSYIFKCDQNHNNNLQW